jgi:hypothetical protein
MNPNPEKLFAKALLFLCSTTLAALALSLAQGTSTPYTAALALSLGISLCLVPFLKALPTPPRPSGWDWLMLTLFTIVSLRGFMFLLETKGPEWRVQIAYNLGDMTFHTHLINYLASGTPFWPKSPILAGDPLSYPIGMDFFNSQLLLLGVPFQIGLTWCGIVGAALTGYALWRWGGAFAIAALLFNGGLAALAFDNFGKIDLFDQLHQWRNLFLTLLIPQRNFLYALPCGLFLLTTWRAQFFRENPNVPLPLQTVLYASMPLFSVHSFLFLSLTLLSIFIFEPKSRQTLLKLVAAAFLPSCILLWFVTGGLSATGNIRWHPGWTQEEHPPLKFWAYNFGITLPLLATLTLTCFEKTCSREKKVFVLTSTVTFVACLLFAFAPWPWDNTKLLLWAWLCPAPYLQNLLSKLRLPISIPTYIVLFFSGAVALYTGLNKNQSQQLITNQELYETKQILQDIPFHLPIATHPNHRQPVHYLGRPVICGAEGHLWSHGTDYKEKAYALKLALLFAESPKPEDQNKAIEIAKSLEAGAIFLRGTQTRPPILLPVPQEK